LPALSEKAQKVSKYKTLKLDSDSMGQKIQSMRQSGKFKEGEGRDNQLTRAIAEKQKIDEQIATLGLDAKAIKEGEVEIAKVAETTKTTTTQIEALEKRIEELNGEFADLSASAPTTKPLEAIKKKMSELGVTGLDDIQTVSQLKEKLKGLEDIELAKLQSEIDSIGDISKQTEEEIQKMGDSIRGATDEIKAQDEAAAS
jgi:chromosome segregation ATPase